MCVCVFPLKASLLPKYPFNHGALFATAHLISDKDISLHEAAGEQLIHVHYAQEVFIYTYCCFVPVAYLNNFTGNSPWRSKVSAYIFNHAVAQFSLCSLLGYTVFHRSTGTL